MKSLLPPVVIAGYILLTAISFSFGLALCLTHKREAKLRNQLETIPLRDNYRKEYVVELPDPVVGPIHLLDDSHLLYTAFNELVICNFRDSTEPAKRLLGHLGTITDIDISPDGRKIVSASSDGTIRLWDARTGTSLAESEPLDTLDQPSWTMLMDVTFTSNGRRILSTDMWGIKEWRARDCKLMRVEESDIFYLRWGLVAPDGKTCCAPVIQGGNEIVDRAGKTLLFSEKSDDILCYSPDGASLLFATADKGMLYRLNVRRLLRQDGTVGLTPFIGAPSPMQCAAFSRDGKQVVSADSTGKVYVWNAREGCLRETLTTDESNLLYVDFDLKGYWILAADPQSRRVHIWAPYIWVY